MEKSLMVVVGAMLTLGMIIAIVNMAQAAQPVPQYTCPICGEQFFTYNELYNHFVVEHPATPIQITWE